MANQTVPITLQWAPTVADVTALDINQLGTLIADQLSGTIRADVQFFQIVLFDPTTFTSQLIFNIPQNVWKSWNQSAGRYRPVTQYANGDIKYSFVNADDVANGWVVVDGRAISAIQGLAFTQLQVLETFFGTGGSLPTVPEIVPVPASPSIVMSLFCGFP